MSNFSDYLENKIIGATLCKSSFTWPTTVYLALIASVNGTNMTSYTEVCTNVFVASLVGYVRQPMVFAAPDSNNITRLASNIVFTSDVTTWSAAQAIAIFDSQTYGGGNPLFWTTASTPRFLQPFETYTVYAGSLSVTLL